MIGNDIIDLSYTKETTNWQRPGFLAKVFNETEQDAISRAQDPFLLVWELWSMKEAAYKSYLRQGGTAFNNPKRIKISLSNTNKSSAKVDSFQCELFTEKSTDYILSFTLSPSRYSQVNEAFKISHSDPSTQSAQAYKKLFKRIAIDWHLDESALCIKKGPARIPQLYLRDQKLEIVFSLSHHGQFGAFSFLKSV